MITWAIVFMFVKFNKYRPLELLLAMAADITIVAIITGVLK